MNFAVPKGLRVDRCISLYFKYKPTVTHIGVVDNEGLSPYSLALPARLSWIRSVQKNRLPNVPPTMLLMLDKKAQLRYFYANTNADLCSNKTLA